MEGTGRPASGSVLTSLVREEGRERNRAILIHREAGAKGSVTAGTRHGVRDNFIDVSSGSSFKTWRTGKTKEIILIYSYSSILTVPRPNSGCLRLAWGDFGLWLQLKSDLKVELRLVNTEYCISVFVVFRRELLRIWTEEPGSGRGNFILCLTLRARLHFSNHRHNAQSWKIWWREIY